MKVDRKELVAALEFAKIGASLKGELLQQSNSFIFDGGRLITFNEEIKTDSPSSIDIAVAVLADEFLKVLGKFPDDEVDISTSGIDGQGRELIIKGNRKSAGITCFDEITLPHEAVPTPDGWNKLGEDVPDMLQHAASVCGHNVAQERTTMVHITPDVIEASDNYRILRAKLKTSFDNECMIPATSIKAMRDIKIKRVSVGEGWVHFRTAAKQIISVRCSHELYHNDMEKIMRVNGSAITFPRNLAEILSRASVMMDTDDRPQISIELSKNKIKVESRKDNGWYRESKKTKYDGVPLNLLVNPASLLAMLKRTRLAEVDSSGCKMKITADNIQFMIALTPKEAF